MGMANNDPNWRIVAHADIAENTPVYINGDGEVQLADPNAKATCAIGIVPQAIKAGDRAPVIRQGTLSKLVGFSAGDVIYLAADGTLDHAAAANPHYTQRLGYISVQDPTLMFIDIEDPAHVAQTAT
jgi:hypothetical protein